MAVDQRALAASSIVLEDPPLDFAPLPPARSQLVVFDFDWSLAEQDSDRWIHELLSPELRKEFIRLKDSMQFTDMWCVASVGPAGPCRLTGQRAPARGAAQAGPHQGGAP